MSFARYKGKPVEHLLQGRVYGAKDAMGGDAAGGGMLVNMADDAPPRMFLVTPDDKAMADWDVSDKAYAVVLKPDGLEDFRPGEVVVVSDWSEDGKLEVAGLGYVGRDSLELLDRTNVFPGATVMDEETGEWKRVLAVDDSLWVRVNGSFRSPEEFRFPVSHDFQLLAEPLTTCVKEHLLPFPYDTTSGLTVGKRYWLKATVKTGAKAGWVTVVNDKGDLESYPADVFRLG